MDVKTSRTRGTLDMFDERTSGMRLAPCKGSCASAITLQVFTVWTPMWWIGASITYLPCCDQRVEEISGASKARTGVGGMWGGLGS